jgi:hypothetical protein
MSGAVPALAHTSSWLGAWLSTSTILPSPLLNIITVLEGGKDRFRDLGLGGRIILKWILEAIV